MHRSPMGLDEEYSSEGRVKRSKGIAPWLPILGLLLMVSFGVISFILAQPLYQTISTAFPMDIAPDLGAIITGGVLFVVLMVLGFLIYSIFAPKQSHLTNERTLERERKAMHAAAKQRKLNQRKVAMEMRRQREAESQRKGGKR